MDSIDESSTDNESDHGSKSANSLKYIWYGNQIHIELSTRDPRLKICDRIKQTQNEWKGAELSENSMDKGLHKVFKSVVSQLNNVLPTLL